MLLARKRTETIKFSDFMNKEGTYNRKEKKPVTERLRGFNVTEKMAWVPMIGMGVYLMNKFQAQPLATQVMATSGAAVPVGAISGEVKQRIIHAFDPLMELMIDVALPITGVMITGGCLLILIGQKERGFSLILNSSLGYVLVNLSPMILSLLAGVGSAI